MRLFCCPFSPLRSRRFLIAFSLGKSYAMNVLDAPTGSLKTPQNQSVALETLTQARLKTAKNESDRSNSHKKFE
jgi:hypothetical protein